MNIVKEIHPSIIAALNNEDNEESLMAALEEQEEVVIDRFTFGDKEPTLVDAIKAVIELSEDSMLNDTFYLEAEEALSYLRERLAITNGQAVMLSIIVNNFTNQRIDVTDFASHLRCNPITLLPLLKEMKGLEERGYVVCNTSDFRPTYRIPYATLEAFNDNQVPTKRSLKGMSCQELIDELDQIFDQHSEHEMSIDGLRDHCRALLSDNRQLHFVNRVMSYGLDDGEMILLLFMVNQFVNYNDNNVTQTETSQLYDHRQQWYKLRHELQTERTRLQQLGVVEFSLDGGLGDRNAFCLSLNAKRELFAELDISIAEEKPCRGLMSHHDIKAHQLFYDTTIDNQIADLTRLLCEENYQLIRQRLLESGFRCGFTCLFYGGPGTGKTETVLQLARQTKRNILQVNVSEIKSKWVGDSEKNIKALFDDYRRLAKDSKTTPILLFNEADAIINRRQENAERGVDKMENSIQNIILQEMETLDGILIATTNLEQNMDKAFERRFLYKIRFEKPTAEARQHIWHEMIPSLPADAVTQLAARYDFSGGQIENIARHHTIDSILHGSEADDLATLIAHCDQERLEKKGHRIGF